MHRFAFVIHPLKAKDAARKFPIAKYFPEWVIKKVYGSRKPFIGSFVDGVVSKTGAQTEGWFIICPLTPDMMMKELPLERVYERLEQCAELAKAEGAEVMGLGAFTSVVGDGGVTVQQRTGFPITTGNSYTIATAVQGALKAADLVGVDPKNATLGVVGATGSIGKTCARMLAPQFGSTIVVGRDEERTQLIADELERARATVNVGDIKGRRCDYHSDFGRSRFDLSRAPETRRSRLRCIASKGCEWQSRRRTAGRLGDRRRSCQSPR